MEDKWIERQTNGTFALGHAGGPGRPKRSTEENYLQVLSEQVTLKDWTEVVQRALDDAKNGDNRARDWLGKYLMGDKPAVAMLLKPESTIDAVAVAAELRKDPDSLTLTDIKAGGVVNGPQHNLKIFERTMR